ncbi:hypothetical protein CKQ90_36465, partial [Klebsiella pneumoniae]
HLKSGKKLKADCLLYANGRTGNTDTLALEISVCRRHLKSGKKLKADCLLYANGRTGNTDTLALEISVC